MMKLIHGDCRDYIDDVVKGEGNPVIVSDPPPFNNQRSHISTICSHNSFGITALSLAPFNPCVPVFAPLGAET